MTYSQIEERLRKNNRELEIYKKRKSDLEEQKEIIREDVYNSEMAQLDGYISNLSRVVKSDEKLKETYMEVKGQLDKFRRLAANMANTADLEELLKLQEELGKISEIIRAQKRNLDTDMIIELSRQVDKQSVNIEENVEEKETLPKESNKQDNIDLLADDFDINSISPEDFKKAYYQAIMIYQNDPKKLQRLNELNDQMKKRLRQVNDDKYKRDVNGNIEYFPNTNIPKPRERGIYESDQDYVSFLKDYYEEIYNKQKKNEPLLGLPGPVLGEVPRLPGPVEEKPKKKEAERDLITIFEELTAGLEVKKKDGKKYKASNIKVLRSFKNEMSSGNWLYNVVHFIPAVVKLPFKLIQKLKGKIVYRKETKERMEILKKRIENLSDEDLMIIYNEYRGSRVNQERFPTGLNILLEERIEKFVFSKVSKLNNEIETLYNEIFSVVQQLEVIDEKLANSKLSTAEKKKLTVYRSNLLNGRAGQIKAIREKYKEANLWYSGGVHGFSEDMKAAMTKLSCVGMKFAKEHDLDLELLKKEAALGRAEKQAVAEGDDEAALSAFVQTEMLLSENTEIRGSIFGKRSVGKKYYSPLAERLDYRDDPFVRDLFTSIAVAGATVSAVNAIRVHGTEADKIISSQQAEATRVNNDNDQIMAGVSQTGRDIVSRRGDMMEGMKVQAQSDVLNASNEIERAILDKTDWKLGTNEYHAFDDSGHQFFGDFYNNTETALQDVAVKYGSGAITEQQAMQLLSDISNSTQQTFQNVTSECLKILQPYAASHPQFDLVGVQEAMTYLVQHPDAIEKMNNAMIDVTNMGEGLIGLSAEHISALQSLPSDLKTTLFGAASAGALAYKVTNTMQANDRKGKYGNEVTRMLAEYVSNFEETEEEKSSENTK